MMIQNTYSEKENYLFPKEIEDVIFSTRPEWSRAKEDIWKEMEAKMDVHPIEKKVQPLRRLQVLKYAAVACVALLISFGAVASLYTKNVITAMAEKSFLLPDNSKVVLHANSSLSYKPLLWKFSRTTKLNGEAYFEVEKGSKFEVVSEKATTMVLGTHFMVTARANEYQVQCFEGKVRVITSDQKDEVVITAGQEATLMSGKKFEVIQQHQNQPKEIISSSNQLVEEKELTNSVAKPEGNPKEEVKTEPASQNNKNQEKIQTQTSSEPDVKTNALNGLKIGHQNGNEKPTNGVETKTQSDNQEHISSQEHQEETSGKPAENSKNRFRNSLSKKQIDILEDNTMDRAERQKAFMKSLSNEQRRLLKDQNAEMGLGNGAAKNGAAKNVGADNGGPKNVMKDNVKQGQKGHKNQMPNNQMDNMNKGGNGLQKGGGKPSPK